ncbi:FAD-dependent oxidoreductase [Pseudonocardia nigra]|uniref:FAD-dependent oxidoreductase n=1 Tax=Pseudonocardia nigra TaxID=1921578 RepID=UPI001FE736A4|nr:FAD-dependent oxidoreductase [Pseudonocardia nigra]
MDVVVVGAGLGGLAAAVAASRAGHAVTVLERAPAVRETGAGIGIMPNGVLALDALGLGEPVRAQAFEDAAVLGAVLTGAADVPAALRAYDARRAGRVATLQRAARRANRLLGLSGPRARLRDAALRRVPAALATRALAAQFRFDPPPLPRTEPRR